MQTLREPVPLPSGNFTISMNANGTYVTSSPLDVGNLNWDVIKTVLTEEFGFADYIEVYQWRDIRNHQETSFEMTLNGHYGTAGEITFDLSEIENNSETPMNATFTQVREPSLT
jgi:hypothetical protein